MMFTKDLMQVKRTLLLAAILLCSKPTLADTEERYDSNEPDDAWIYVLISGIVILTLCAVFAIRMCIRRRAMKTALLRNAEMTSRPVAQPPPGTYPMQQTVPIGHPGHIMVPPGTYPTQETGAIGHPGHIMAPPPSYQPDQQNAQYPYMNPYPQDPQQQYPPQYPPQYPQYPQYPPQYPHPAEGVAIPTETPPPQTH